MFNIASFNTGLSPFDPNYFKRIKALSNFELPETEDIYCFQSLYGYYYGFLTAMFYPIFYILGQYDMLKRIVSFLYVSCLVIDRVFSPFYYNPRKIIVGKLSLLTTYTAQCTNKTYFGFDNGLLIITNKQVVNYFYVKFPRESLIYNNGLIVMDFKHDLDRIFTLGNTQLYNYTLGDGLYKNILKRSRQINIIKNSQKTPFHFLAGNLNINYHNDRNELNNIAASINCGIPIQHNINNIYTQSKVVKTCYEFKGYINKWVDHILVNNLITHEYSLRYYIGTNAFNSDHNMLFLSIDNNKFNSKFNSTLHGSLLTQGDYDML